MLRNWDDLRAPDLAQAAPGAVAVLPMGAVEQHGPHLSINVDRMLIEAVLSRAAGQVTVDALVLPTLAITKSGEHDRHPGTLSLSGDTLRSVLRDITASLARAGVQRLVYFNGHGGNTAVLEEMVRDARIAHGMIAVHTSWFAFAEAERHLSAEALTVDIHAGLIETAAMLAAAPDLVVMSRAQDFRPAMLDWQDRFRWIGLTGEAARPGWIVDDLNAAGACGDASAATVELGEALLAAAGQNFAAFLEEFAGFDHRLK